MSQLISLNTVRNVLTVTNRTPASISRRASKQHCPKRFLPYRSRTLSGSFDRSNAARACGLVIMRNAASKFASSSLASSLASNCPSFPSTTSRSLPAAFQAGFADFRRRQQVGHVEIRLRRIGHQRERIVGLAQESGVLAVRQPAAGVAHRLGQQHVGRQIGPPAEQIRRPRSRHAACSRRR